METISKIFSFTMWVLTAIIIIPCVFVANHLYPWWTEWGEGF